MNPPGAQQKRFTGYDLLNNITTHKKWVTFDNQCYTHKDYTYIYDADNLLQSVTTPEESGKPSYATFHHYDKNWRQIKTVLHDAHEIDFNYDERGQLLQKTWQRQGRPHTQTQHYDKDGRVTSVTDSAQQCIDYTYTANGLILSIAYPDSHTIKYAYDDFDRITNQVDVNGVSQNYTYKTADKGEVSSIQQANNTIDFVYGSDENGSNGRLVQRIMAVDKNKAGHTHTHTHFYYGAKGFPRLVASSNDTTTFNVNYRYSLPGQLTEQKTTAKQKDIDLTRTRQLYQYDSMNRLSQETYQKDNYHQKDNYRYDGNENITEHLLEGTSGRKSTHYRYNALDQLITIDNGTRGIVDHIHDVNGRLTCDSQGITYEYDDQDFILHTQTALGQQIDYHYLANGLLGKRLSSKGYENFYYDKNSQTSSLNTETQSISLLRHQGDVYASTNAENTAQWFMENRNTGAILKDNRLVLSDFDGYGKQVNRQSTNEIDKLGWLQEYTDPEAQLTYLHSRFYSPVFRRFITRDTYLVDNRYAYGSGNPINYIDPTGHSTQQIVNYTIGASSTAFGIYATYESIVMAIIGAILAVPTGGGSLSLTAGSAVVASVAATASGIALMGSQGALDAGNKTAAEALNYTSLAFSAIHVVSGIIAIAPKIENLITRISERISIGRTAASVHPEADASTIYHFGSDLYEGEKDLVKVISQWNIVRHGLHAVSKITTDGFNLENYLKNSVSHYSPGMNIRDSSLASVATSGNKSQFLAKPIERSMDHYLGALNYTPRHHENGNTAGQNLSWHNTALSTNFYPANKAISVILEPMKRKKNASIGRVTH